MTTTLTDIDRIDTDIRQAWAAVKAARTTCARCPNADNATAAERAEMRVNALLERRHKATR